MLERAKEFARSGDIPLAICLGSAVGGLAGYGLAQSSLFWMISGGLAAGGVAVWRGQNFVAHRFMSPKWRQVACYLFMVLVVTWALLAIFSSR
jgi:hypothetical protein